ncbi:MAG TPA: hypothetical protein VGY58_21430 [Gemmataceae bacterium]|jgi:adenylate cyclase|nr:hypothetical protein [Gemmataceae bacterium]
MIWIRKRRGDDCVSACSDEAEACFHKAIAVARRQGARSLELRAALSLARLWQRQGKAIEAKKILANVYDGFDEGFGTGDLREARALLDALALTGGRPIDDAVH